MAEVMGYADAISVRPGETISFRTSCTGTERYRARIVRVLSPEAGPGAPPYRTEPLDPPFDRILPAHAQPLHAGSFAVVTRTPLIEQLTSFTVQALVWPTLPGTRRQAVLGTWSESTRTGFGLLIAQDGTPELRLGDGGEAIVLGCSTPLLARRWYLLAASFDAESGVARLYVTAIGDHRMDSPCSVSVEGHARGVRPGPQFLFAAWHEADDDGLVPPRPRVGGCFNGRIDRPRLASRALDRAEIEALAGETIPAALGADVVAAWDFARDITTETIRDASPNRLDGFTVDLPTRAVTGHNWDGTETCWTRAPQQYGAIHFHEDDLSDARWPTAFSFEVPASLRSGCYAALLEAAEAEFQIPFFVRPAKAAKPAPVVYLAASATYTVYCNNAGRFRTAMTEVMQGRLTVIDAIDALLLRHPELGLSTYDRHSDGSGVSTSSRLRPATNTRPTGRLWNYCADLFIVDWLERSGISFDVVTDEDLHREGLDAIRGNRVLVTGSHPEYASREMLDALEAFLRRGNRMMYLGGNGFYWRIAYHPGQAGIIEVRRAEDGTRAWDAEPGEYYHAFTGEYGGLWRRNGRPPQALAGVGFISQGFDHSVPYHRGPGADDPRAAFIFAGVPEQVIGDFGTMQGGAAGLEIDWVDPQLGTPPHALVLASSADHSNTYELVAEEVRVAHGMTDGLLAPEIRADMVFFEARDGGAVFSTGSIAYAGALGHNGFDNSVARLTWNVLRRFADPAPFAMPELTPARGRAAAPPAPRDS